MIVAHIVLEARTPLKIGSSEVSFLKDAPVQKDWNGLPMILGSSLAGVLRSFFNEKEAANIFGWQNHKKNEGEGSRIIISNALLLDENGRVHEEILLEKSRFLKNFENLPLREHTAINHRGVAKKHAKFDEEVVFAGSRFKFSIEFMDDVDWQKILAVLSDEQFRIGGGSTKGFGKVEVLDITYDEFEKNSYIEYSSSLNYPLEKNFSIPKKEAEKYKLLLKPENFFIFGSGISTKEADMTPVFEDVVDYEKKGLRKKQILIPASTIKGILAHRIAYHFNRKNGIFAEDIEKASDHIGENNPAVRAILGHKKEKKNDQELGRKGKVYFSDCIKNFEGKTKICNHVKLDRFTGGAIEGALFNEKVVSSSDEYEIEIVMREELGEYREYLEKALKDIANGLLPLGAATTKGHGFFRGKVYRNGEVI